MSYISAPNTYYSAESQGKMRYDPTGSIGKNDFLLLLITQLRHQDPMAPMDDKEFISQLAQFSVLEEVQELNRNVSDSLGMNWYYQAMNTAMSLIGCHITARVEEDGEDIQGVVARVGFKDYEWRLYLEDGREVPLSKIIEAKKA